MLVPDLEMKVSTFIILFFLSIVDFSLSIVKIKICIFNIDSYFYMIFSFNLVDQKQ